MVELDPGDRHIALPKCYICGERFPGGLLELDRHLEHRHAADLMPYRCATCGVDGFLPIRSMRAINKHFALHDVQERPHRCVHCTLRFRTERNLHSHVRLFHRGGVKSDQNTPLSSCQPDPTTDGARRFQCRHCDSSYSSPSARKRHENTHTHRIHYRCAVCGKEFTKLDCLTQHERIHSQTRPYACDQCPSRFIQLAHLRIHKRARHSGERPHVCAICNRGFRCRTGLKVHGRIHTGEKPFRCTVCDMAFGDAGTLRKHGAVHRETSIGKDGTYNGRRLAISTGRG
ncbi:AGAP003056-PA-like protein [Anopheles sinensis]|uniref:AGAP003056-PA-like protein n=1 Tax=Anopheles sinensis TaxID=74873 RepID=A0A084VDC2_ANOSI|nr:AGAP003056-PA-like protein [Anopheles sinensis]